MSNSDTILMSEEGAVLTITLNRPSRMNAFSEEMHLAFHAALARAESPDIRAVLITGAGKGFCAGQDLGERDPAKMDAPPDLENTITRFFNPSILKIRNLEKPVICAVNGVAAGAGANIALGCDIVIASEEAKFIQSFARVGLIPDAGGSFVLTRRLGEARAKGLAMTAEPISARRAEEWGLIWKALPASEFLEVAKSLAQEFSFGPSRGFAATKSAIHAASAQDFEAQIKLEAKLQGICGRSRDYAEGVSAFLEKRGPKFLGK